MHSLGHAMVHHQAVRISNGTGMSSAWRLAGWAHSVACLGLVLHSTSPTLIRPPGLALGLRQVDTRSEPNPRGMRTLPRLVGGGGGSARSLKRPYLGTRVVLWVWFLLTRQRPSGRTQATVEQQSSSIDSGNGAASSLDLTLLTIHSLHPLTFWGATMRPVLWESYPHPHITSSHPNSCPGTTVVPYRKPWT